MRSTESCLQFEIHKWCANDNFLWFENGSLCTYMYICIFVKQYHTSTGMLLSIIFISKAYCTNNTANRVSVNSKSGEHPLAQNERILSPSLWIYGFACHVIMIIIMWEMFFRGSLYTKKSCFQILFIMCHASEKCPSSVQV